MHRWVSALMMAITGAVFFAVFVSQDIRLLPELAWGDLPWAMILRYALAMTFGGALAGLLFSWLFGRSGIGGWILAMLGGLIAALISGFFGSAFGLLPDLLADGYHTSDLVRAALGVLVIPLSVIEQPFLIAVLVVLIAATHVLTRRSRQAG